MDEVALGQVSFGSVSTCTCALSAFKLHLVHGTPATGDALRCVIAFAVSG
jgi:hypothetical protein